MNSIKFTERDDNIVLGNTYGIPAANPDGGKNN